MTDKSLDRRARRTRKLLSEALFALILEKGYDAVTIEDITRRADLGRTTFYLHYRDKEDLLLQSIEETADELASRVAHLYEEISQTEMNQPPSEPSASASPVLFVFQHAAENADIYRIILRGEGAYQVMHRIREIASRYAMGFLSARFKENNANNAPSIPLEVIANFFAGSLLGMLTWWLESGMPYPPAEMAHMFRQMTFLGLQQAVQPLSEARLGKKG